MSASTIIRLGPLCVALVLTGCASTGSNTDHAALDDLFSELNTDYSYRTQSDPLGAYLANRSQSDIRISYGNNRSAQSGSQDSGVANIFANTALSFLGVKYRFGGENPSTGFDCSGLVSYVAEKSLGLKLPRQSAQMAKEGESVKRGQLEEGDLVFFNTRGARFSHVGIYLGDNKFVHAPRTGAVVRVEDMTVAYWKNRYNGARRLATAN
ncbi:C40 family peptidase [Paenalcaligenes niemegkensis]|uniref:C40 family peptidase n=1 Tax=Paenalcaligenes niemegkensis TaxID=2895469 RepID=UPI001EE8F5D3|nr:C40 family peptidase [Paenalcaligenes niemegkensis]MCQ9616868.1 C40 family peptidase [Paenalcaligenes niemegkensis]